MIKIRPIPKKRRIPRLFWTMQVSLLLTSLVFLLAPQQIPVTLYKLSLITVAGVAGYWLDRALFPYARPDVYLSGYGKLAAFLFAVAMMRRAIIVAAVMIAVGLGA